MTNDLRSTCSPILRSTTVLWVTCPCALVVPSALVTVIVFGSFCQGILWLDIKDWEIVDPVAPQSRSPLAVMLSPVSTLMRIPSMSN
jgi:hypothetical protein